VGDLALLRVICGNITNLWRIGNRPCFGQTRALIGADAGLIRSARPGNLRPSGARQVRPSILLCPDFLPAQTCVMYA
jgi:hypothetical protein